MDYTLLTVLGERPQVMTELIWSLAREDKYPSRIIVLTTAAGERILNARLRGDRDYRHIDLWDDRWTPFCRQVLQRREPLDIEVEVPTHADGTKVEDIYDSEDGRLFENWCFDLVHSLTGDDAGSQRQPLYGCIAGGRKTMTQDVTTAFTLYARRGDRLFHVVVSRRIEEEHPDFFWPREDRPEHARLADDVHRVDKAFPHLRARLEEGLLSEVSGADEHSHYQDLLDELDPDRRALARPQQVTLRTQPRITEAGTRVSGASIDCELSVADARGTELGSISLSPTLVATWLVLMNRLWRPGERVVTSKSQLVTKEVDEQRRAVLEALGYATGPHGDVKLWVEPEYWGDDKKYPSYYSTHISELGKDPFKEEENPEAEPLFERYFNVVRPPENIVPADCGEWPYYALPAPLPEDIELQIESPALKSLASKRQWPFEHLPVPVEGNPR